MRTNYTNEESSIDKHTLHMYNQPARNTTPVDGTVKAMVIILFRMVKLRIIAKYLTTDGNY